MSEHLWPYWFPIILGVGVASAYLGRPRGTLIGILGAVYWLGLSVSALSDITSLTPLAFAGLLAGAATIIATGYGMGKSEQIRNTPKPQPKPPIGDNKTIEHPDSAWDTLSEIITRFDNWITTNQHQVDPWPDFGELLRSTLVTACGAKHIRAYRLLTTDDSQLYPLRRTDPDEKDFPSARGGILGHVVTTGKSYYAGDPAQGALIDELANDSNLNITWCFAIKQNHRTIGVIQVGEMSDTSIMDRSKLPLIEGIITMCWTALTESCRSRLAGFTDPVSGVLTHTAFVQAGKQSLQSSYDHGEPVALINISVEGLRTLADNGQWDLANQVLYEVSSVLKERLRQDDEIGVFDGSRFLLLMRRVDSELAILITKQLIAKLNTICDDRDRWGNTLSVRCGLAGSGVSQPTLRTLISRASQNCMKARKQQVPIVSDLPVGQTEVPQS